jgi:sec-independent protein translocase protein TatC
VTATAPPVDRREEDAKVLTIIEHLVELRNRVMIASIALVVGVLASIWPLTPMTIDFLMQPGRDQMDDFTLHQFTLLDYWSTYFRVSLMLGLAIAMPMIIYQMLSFIAPGLTPQERKWLYPIVGGASVMFILGLAFAYYVELPPALRFLLNPASDGVEPTIGVRTYVDTVTRLMVLTGLVFQLPFLIMGLVKIGVVTSRKLLGWWRYAVLAAVVLAAIVTPSIDPVTQTIVAVPILVLYFMGIALAKLVEGNTFLGARQWR